MCVCVRVCVRVCVCLCVFFKKIYRFIRVAIISTNFLFETLSEDKSLTISVFQKHAHIVSKT